jgi:YfiH family protein
VSHPPFDSLNLGRPSGDDAMAVEVNRQRLADAIGHAPVFMHQVHGVASVVLPLASASTVDAVIEADACTSSTPGTVCTVRVADCLPVLLTDAAGRAVAAAHAGWRGLAQGVLEHNFAQFAALPALDGKTGNAAPVAQRTLAWLGPCIGPQAFEVGPEVRAAFLLHDPAAERCFVPRVGGKWMADLAALARMRLQALGITRVYGNDSSREWCTVGNPSRFFSHRRDSVALGGSGRMAACIWID